MISTQVFVPVCTSCSVTHRQPRDKVTVQLMKVMSTNHLVSAGDSKVKTTDRATTCRAVKHVGNQNIKNNRKILNELHRDKHS